MTSRGRARILIMDSLLLKNCARGNSYCTIKLCVKLINLLSDKLGVVTRLMDNCVNYAVIDNVR